jgi:hypothetical protein
MRKVVKWTVVKRDLPVLIDPYICFGLCKNHHQWVQNYVHSTSNVISALIVVQYLSMQVTFTYKIRVLNVYENTEYKIVTN